MAGKQFKTMDVWELLALRGEIDALLAAKRKELERSKPRAASRRRNGRAAARADAKPKYQSRKNKALKWSGRGSTPAWMTREMKGTKLKKADFRISR
jgi:DNA-binding protein H-NS